MKSENHKRFSVETHLFFAFPGTSKTQIEEERSLAVFNSGVSTGNVMDCGPPPPTTTATYCLSSAK